MVNFSLEEIKVDHKYRPQTSFVGRLEIPTICYVRFVDECNSDLKLRRFS